MNISINIKEKKFDRIIFQNTSFEFKNQHFYMMIAPSGSGKTTLFNMLIGLDTSYQGEIYYDNLLLKKNIDMIRKEKLGILFQNFELTEELNAYDNVLLGATLSGLELESIDQKIKDLFKELDLEECLFKKVYQLSTGQKQRVAFARAIIKEPSFIICDEPTGNLDENSERILMNYLKDYYNHHECCILMATHNQDLREYATDIITIKDEKIETVKTSLVLEKTQSSISRYNHSIFYFLKTFFENHTLHYVLLSFFLSLCMICLFVSYNLGYQTIQKVQTFLDTDLRCRTIYVDADYYKIGRIDESILPYIQTIEHVELIDANNSDTFGRYGLEKTALESTIHSKPFIESSRLILLLSDKERQEATLLKGTWISHDSDIMVDQYTAQKLEEIYGNVLGLEVKMTLPFVGKYEDYLYSDELGTTLRKTDPKVEYVEDTFTIVGVYKFKDKDGPMMEIIFSNHYINQTIKKVALPLENNYDLSNQTYSSINVISEDASYNEDIAKHIEGLSPWIKVDIPNYYDSLEYILQQRDVFTVVSFLVYGILIYSILEIQRLNYKRKKDYLHKIRLLGGSPKDLRLFFLLEGGLFFILSGLITYSLNAFVLSQLNGYFKTQNFMYTINMLVGEMNFVYMNFSVFIFILFFHFILIILIEAYYYKKVLGGWSHD